MKYLFQVFDLIIKDIKFIEYIKKEINYIIMNFIFLIQRNYIENTIFFIITSLYIKSIFIN